MRPLACLAAAFTLAAVPAVAQQQVTGRPTTPFKATMDPAASPAGTYALTGYHVGVIVRVLHAGFSYSVFRMDKVTGSLTWDPARIEASKVTATIAANSLSTNVPGFAATLTGPTWLDAAKYPAITFTSTSIRRTGPTTGLIAGDLTLHGVTRPVTLDATLTGAGQGPNAATLGFTANTVVRRSDFGAGPALDVVGDEMKVEIDLEFVKTPT
ncbi:MAG TPA: YceI family protein [Caulobacteraceae bacterium]|jgi:polyisoprenoid-binding protein YceI|nr:YceI family protein [Caulobacteraceae bacterium]